MITRGTISIPFSGKTIYTRDTVPVQRREAQLITEAITLFSDLIGIDFLNEVQITSETVAINIS